jgi:integrase
MRSLGEYGSEAAAAAYRRLLADLEAARPVDHRPDAALVSELALRYLGHAKRYYVGADGRPTSELRSIVTAVRVLLSTHGDVRAADFGPVALKRVRIDMVAKGWTRTHVNAQVRRVVQMFRWAVSEEVVPAGVWEALRSVKGLGAHRTDAPEGGKVGPASDADVEAVLPLLPATVAAMARFQLLTGCRAQDACRVTAAAIDRSGPVWVYRPAEHKGTWRGRSREVYVGPAAQALLAPWLEAGSAGPMFSPRAAVEAQHAERSANRKTPQYASHMARNAAKRVSVRKRGPLERYTTQSYGRAVARACDLAGVARWTPSQLRHSAGTRFRAEFGLEVSRLLLGHTSAVTTEIYAEPDRAKAMAAMAAAG